MALKRKIKKPYSLVILRLKSKNADSLEMRRGTMIETASRKIKMVNIHRDIKSLLLFFPRPPHPILVKK